MHRYIDELSLLHALRLAVVATDTAGVITFVNEAATEAYALDAEGLVGLELRELLPVEPDEAASFDLHAVLAGETWSGDLTVRRPGDGTFVAAVSATPIRSGDGTLVGAVVAAEDMTEIRNAEAEAAASEQLLRLAHEAAQLGQLALGHRLGRHEVGRAAGGHLRDDTRRVRRHLRRLGGHRAPRRPRRGDGRRAGGARPPGRRTSSATA